MYGKLCLTEKKCTDLGLMPDADSHACKDSTETDKGYELKNGSFVTADECQKTLSYYIYESNGVKKCLSKRECTNIIDYYADVSAKKCVSRRECQSYAYTFNGGSSESKECVDEVGCSANGPDY